MTAKLALGLNRDRPESPLRYGWDYLQRTCTADRLAGLILFLSLSAFMGAFTTLKTLLPSLHPFWADGVLADVDRTIHFGVDPWRHLQPLLGGRLVTQAIEMAYSPGWLIVTSSLPLWVCVFCTDRILRTRFIVAFLACWMINGNMLALAFMSGGPVYFGELAGDAHRFAEKLAALGQSDGVFSAAAQQKMLWQARLTEGRFAGAGISAFPSLHVSMATLAALTISSANRRLIWLMVGYVGLILVGSVHLAWHYAIDGYVSIATTIGLWSLAGRLTSRAPRPA